LLILLSSGARRRYRDDIVRALAHPSGTELRFRYGEDYVDDSVLVLVKSRKLAPTEALVCYLADRPDGDPALLVPCRFATVTRAQMVGTSVILTLSAGAYVQRLDDASLRARMTDAERVLLPNKGSDAKAPPGKFAFRIAAPLTSNAVSEAAGAVAFEKTAEALRAAGFGAGDAARPFYAVRDLTEVVSNPDAADPVIPPRQGRYALKSGKRYALEVYSYAPDGDTSPSDASTLTVEADDSEVKFSSDTSAKLDSRYDLNRFRFSTEHRLLTLPTGLRVTLGVPTSTEGKTVTEERCDIVLELRFAGSAWLAAGRVALIAIGTAAPAITGAYAAQKGSLGLTAVMLLFALATGIATVIPGLGKK
jgi:hypothetical protein